MTEPNTTPEPSQWPASSPWPGQSPDQPSGQSPDQPSGQSPDQPSGQSPDQPMAATAAPRKRSPALVVGIIVVLVAILGAVLYVTRNNVEANDLAVGTCFDVPNGDTVSTVSQHPCTEAHDAEVFSVSQYTAPDSTYPDSSAFDDYAATTCEPAFESYVGETIDASPYDVGYIFPSSDTWGNGDRQITCYATNVDGSKLSQSIKASGSGSGTPASS